MSPSSGTVMVNRWCVTFLLATVILSFAHAQGPSRAPETDVFNEVPAADPSGIVSSEPFSSSSWLVDLPPVDKVSLDIANDTKSLALCLSVGYRDEQDSYFIGLDMEEADIPLFKGQTKPPRIDCERPWVERSPLAFRVFVVVSESKREELGDIDGFRILMAQNTTPDSVIGRSDVDGKENENVLLSDLIWTLEGRGSDGRWERIAEQAPSESLGRSGWILDPYRSGVPALVLADEDTEPAPPISEPEPVAIVSSNGRRSAYSPFYHDLEGHQDPSALYLPAVDAPVVQWSDGENIDGLRLEIIGTLDASKGSYCVRAVHDDGRRRRGFSQLANGEWKTSDDAIVDASSACRAATKASEPVAFPMTLVIGEPALNLGDGGLRIGGAPPSARPLHLEDARISLSLRSDGEVLGSAGGNSGGRWYTSADGVPTLLLRGKENRPGGKVLRYMTLSGPGGQLQLDGRPWPESEDPVAIDELATLSWEKGAAPSRIVVCGESTCDDRRHLGVLTIEGESATIDPDEVLLTEGATITLGIDRGSVDATAELVSPVAKDELVFAPTVVFGNYSRPLTSCLGQLVWSDQESEPFALRRGKQVLDVTALPEDVGIDTKVKVTFGRSRNGGPCPFELRETLEPLTMARLRDLGVSGEIAVPVKVDAPIFVGYLQLNAAPYRTSLARWKNALEFYDRVYRQGRSTDRWADGVLFGTGERGGLVPSVEPASNFVTALTDASGLRTAADIARAERDRNRVPISLFEEQLEEIGELFDAQPIWLLYYDDLASNCSAYAEAVDYAAPESARITVLAGIRGFTGSDDTGEFLPGRLAHVCTRSDRLVVYAFNWEERAYNEDFKLMLDTVLDDMDKTRGSVQ